MLELIETAAPRWRPALKAALVGDALGVSFEFQPGHSIPHGDGITMRMPSTFRKSYPAVPCGTWSDDGSQMLALLAALVADEGRYDATRFGRNLVDWYRHGRFQAGGRVFDCGLQTSRALECIEAGIEFKAAPGPMCGNGSLMRVLPVAALPDTFGISPSEALQIAMAQSSLTHPQPLARMVCAVYVALCWQLAEGAPMAAALDAAFAQVAAVGLRPEEADWLPRIRAHERELHTGSGYVLNTFWAAVWAASTSNSCSAALRKAISLGDDTDTVACVAGGLAALLHGLDALTLEWGAQLIDARG